MTLMLTESMDQQVLSTAVVAYLGWGITKHPRRDAFAVRDVSADDNVILGTREVVSDVLAFDADDLPEPGAAVAAYARELYPWLSSDAVDAIVWNYFWGWR